MPAKAHDGRYDHLLNEMKRRVRLAVDSNKKIVWLDETVFTKATNRCHEWSRPHANHRLPCEAMGTGYTAVCAAISERCGVEHIELYDRAVDEERFKEFLIALA